MINSEFTDDYEGDLLDELNNLSFVDKDMYEYYCEGCGWQGDDCDYAIIYPEYDDEGYPVTETKYIEKCPWCNTILNF